MAELYIRLLRHNVHIRNVRAVYIPVVSCVSYVLTIPGPLNPQDGLTPLMLAAQFGNLSVAKLLVETYHCDLNEKSSDKVSVNYAKWEECVSTQLTLAVHVQLPQEGTRIHRR